MRGFTKSCAIAVALAVPAFANASLQVEELAEDTVVIMYETAAASTETGRAELERKVRRMARKVCGSQKLRMAGTITQWQINRSCYNEAVANAIESIENTLAANG
ncbi:MAG: UrcA family protein [Pseudomonadales bacterium]|jgi:UrcA family protein|nr:UrcA family protein [Pseudomonadales bacterium]